MEIIFIRHTEKEETGEDPYLTKKGIKQAKHLAKRLSKESFTKFYCSEMNRAKQTADIISKEIKLKPKIEISLNEFKNSIIKERENKWDEKEKKHYNQLISFIKKISKKPEKNEKILIIAHGITNRIILSNFLNLDLNKLMPFRQSEGGINSIYWVEKFKNWRLKIWNDNNHIPEKLRYSKFSYLF